MSEFDHRVKLLKALGVEFTQEYEYRGEHPTRKQYSLEIFRSVKLPLLPIEWCALFMQDGGAYVGGCCGAMSHLQDMICHEIRMNSGRFEIRTLAEIAEVMVEHDGDENNDNEDFLTFAHLPQGETLEGFVSNFVRGMADTRDAGHILDPWQMMQVVWHITKDFYSPEVPSGMGNHMSEVEKAISLLSRSLTSISWEKLFDSHPAKAEQSQTKVNRSMLLYRMLPAWKLLNANLDKLDLGPVEGWALMDKRKTPEAICENGHGYCVYDSREKLDEILALWKHDDDQHEAKGMNPPIMDCIGVRRVRISAEKGIEFLD